MPCNERPTRCAPSSDCPPTPDPVLPRCDVVLPDGVFTNATVVVEDGCIRQVQAGSPMLYQPDPCCAPTGGGGGGGDGADGDPGEPGQNATITIGQVSTLAPNEQATVVNVGTATNAVLDFGIPEGVPGEDADPPTGATSNAGGLEIENGLIKTLPTAWPPVLTVTADVDVPGVTVTVTKNDATGAINLDIEGFGIVVDNMQQSITALEQAYNTLADQVQAMALRLDDCCPP